jgi:uncharacterized protein (DUF2249 family)
VNVLVDARGLPPPEPFERAMEALADLASDDTLIVSLDRVPWPLFRILERDGHDFGWCDEGRGVVTVRIAAAGAELPEED